MDGDAAAIGFQRQFQFGTIQVFLDEQDGRAVLPADLIGMVVMFVW